MEFFNAFTSSRGENAKGSNRASCGKTLDSSMLPSNNVPSLVSLSSCQSADTVMTESLTANASFDDIGVDQSSKSLLAEDAKSMLTKQLFSNIVGSSTLASMPSASGNANVTAHVFDDDLSIPSIQDDDEVPAFQNQDALFLLMKHMPCNNRSNRSKEEFADMVWCALDASLVGKTVPGATSLGDPYVSDMESDGSISSSDSDYYEDDSYIEEEAFSDDERSVSSVISEEESFDEFTGAIDEALKEARTLSLGLDLIESLRGLSDTYHTPCQDNSQVKNHISTCVRDEDSESLPPLSSISLDTMFDYAVEQESYNCESCDDNSVTTKILALDDLVLDLSFNDFDIVNKTVIKSMSGQVLTEMKTSMIQFGIILTFLKFASQREMIQLARFFMKNGSHFLPLEDSMATNTRSSVDRSLDRKIDSDSQNTSATKCQDNERCIKTSEKVSVNSTPTALSPMVEAKISDALRSIMLRRRFGERELAIKRGKDNACKVDKLTKQSS